MPRVGGISVRYTVCIRDVGPVKAHRSKSRCDPTHHKLRRKADLHQGRLDVAGVDFASTLIVKTVIVASQLPR